MASLSSKFFVGSDSETESEDESINLINDASYFVKKTPQKSFDDLSDDDKTRRSVKSLATKRRQDFSVLLKKLKNSLKIKDFDVILTDLEQLQRLFIKYKNNEIPQPIIRLLVLLSNTVRSVWEDKEQKNKLSKLGQKALSTLRQKLKKVEDEMKDSIQDCRQNLSAYASDFSEEEEEKEPKIKSKSDQKSAKSTNYSPYIKTEKTKEVKIKRERKIKDVKKIDDITPEIKTPAKFSKELFNSQQEITMEVFLEKVREVTKMRGKKVSDKSVLSQLYNLKQIAENKNFDNAILIKILLLVLSLQLDIFVNESLIKVDRWKSILNNARVLFTLLSETPDIQLRNDISEEDECLTSPPYILMGNPTHVAIKIADELKKIMQLSDPYSLDYLNKMKDIAEFESLLALLQVYVERTRNPVYICDIYLLRVEQMYYQLEQRWLKTLSSELTDNSVDENSLKNTESQKSLLDSFCKYLYRNGTDRVPAKAALYRTYHYALNNDWHSARELFLMSHIYELVNHGDAQIQILYNRVIVQLGLCAFRHGNFKEALSILRDIQLSGRVRELLAQSIVPKLDRGAKQDITERKLLVPFHMHINLELAECAYLLSALAVEGAYAVAPTQELRSNFSSRGFVNMIRGFERLIIQGPPDSMRECVYAAYKSLRVGNWKDCIAMIRNIKCLKLMINYQDFLRKLELHLKRECLVAYLFVNYRAYTQITLSYITNKFELSEKDSKGTINRLIICDSFPASWNSDSTILNIYCQSLPFSVSYLSSAILERLKSVADHQLRVSESVSNIKKLKARSSTSNANSNKTSVI